MRQNTRRSVILRTSCIAILMVLMLVGMLAWGVTTTNAAASTGFSDLSQNNPTYPYAKYLADKKIITGYSDGTYRPGNSITRAEMAVILCKTKNLTVTKPPKSAFKDLNTTYWAYPYIEAVTKAGIFAGYADNTFRPESKVSRVEVATLLMKLSSQPLTPVDVPGGLCDVSPKHWAYSYIAASLDAGIMEKTGTNSFKPNQAATRAQVARGLGITLNLAPEFINMSITPLLSPTKGNVIMVSARGQEQKISGEVQCPVGSTVKTGSDGEAELDFPDGSSLLLEADTEVKILTSQGQSYIKSDGSQGIMVDGLEIKLTRGRVFGGLAANYFINQGVSSTGGVKKGLKNGNKNSSPWWKKTYTKRERMKVDMPWGVAAVRGTIFCCSCNIEVNAISVLDGQAELSSIANVTLSLEDGYIDREGTLHSEGATTPPRGVDEGFLLVESAQNSYAAINSTGTIVAYGTMPKLEKEQWSNKQKWVAKIMEQMRTNIPLGIGPALNSASKINEIFSSILRTTNGTGGTDKGTPSASNDCSLSNLTASAGVLSDVFTPATRDYTLSIPNVIEEITITPTVNESHASVTVQGVSVSSGNPSQFISLTAGVPLDILVVVTAQNGNKITYTVTAIREAVESNDASLSNLTSSAGTWNTPFSPDILNYTIVVATTDSGLTVTPTVSDSRSGVTVNDSAVVSGSSSAPITLNPAGIPLNVPVVVTAQDGTIRTYTLTFIIEIMLNPGELM
ncbi:MAG: S-layer homology domain-containing protein [Chitinophagales bacterium]